MSKKLRFIWIDDDITRRRSATNLAARLNVVVEFINIKKEMKLLQAVFAGVRLYLTGRSQFRYHK